LAAVKEENFMKVNVKKALATLMATTLIVTSGQCPVASAAKKPALSSKKVTLKVGQKKTLKVKNKIKGSKYKWKSSKVKVATVSKKGVVKAIKAGTATITCKVKTKATKKKKAKTYTLKCKVTVKKKKSPNPTAKPTTKPTAKPTTGATEVPSDIPSDTPTLTPSDAPTDVPSTAPSVSPSTAPSASPSADPSASPSAAPSASPSASPTTAPSYNYRPSGGGGNGGNSGTTVTTAEVKNQTELNSALGNSSIKTVTIKTDAVENFTITGNHSDKKIIVEASKAHIENEAQLASVEINAIGENTWLEKWAGAVANKINVKAQRAHIKLDKGAKPEIEVEKSASETVVPEIVITVSAGSTGGTVTLKAVVNLAIKQETAEGTTDASSINVKVAINGDVGEENTAKIVSNVPVNIDTTETDGIKANVAIALNQGAEGSTVKVTKDSASDSGSVGIVNSTENQVIIDNGGSEEKVDSGKDIGASSIKTEATKEQKLVEAIDLVKVEMSKNVTNNTVAKDVTQITLPTTVSGASVTWKSDPANIVSSDGKVNHSTSDVSVVLTATVNIADVGTKSTSFTIVVKASDSTSTDPGTGTDPDPGTTEPSTVTVKVSPITYTTTTAAAVSGTSIEVTPSISEDVKSKVTVTGASSDSAENVECALGASDADVSKLGYKATLDKFTENDSMYLYIKVTVSSTSGEQIVKYFKSGVALTSSGGTLTMNEVTN